jgi:hypothetical protein
MAQTKFRSFPLRTQPNRVDREQRVIYGVSAAQQVDALGHGITLDSKTLQQIVDLGNAKPSGVKSRFTHPGLSSDGMGKHLGRMTNFRVEGDKAVGDLHLADAASKAPDGDLAGYVMDLADEDSAAFGLSIVAGGDVVWTLDNGVEVPVGEERPANALTELPVFRLDALDAVDVVDEPAANRDGMFSAHLWGTNQLAESMFGNFDELLTQVGMTPAQAWGYALKYFDARRVDMKGMAMQEQDNVNEAQDEEIVAAVEIENEDTQEESGVTQEEALSLQAKLAAFEQREQAALAQAAALTAKVEAMEKEARLGRYKQLTEGWMGVIADHMTVLEATGEGSEAYVAYVRQMNALSEQIQTGGLFNEVGRNSKQLAGTAGERLEAEARKIQASDGVSYAKAMELAAGRNPELYSAHVQEMRGE